MSDKVREQIAKLRRVNEIRRDKTPLKVAVAMCHEAADTMQALLDVVETAKALTDIWGLEDTAYADVERRMGDLDEALAKLEEQ